jgi:hypothetical protein
VTEPKKVRAVFSTEDFRLLKQAVHHFLQSNRESESPDMVKFSNLYHRLGRL